MSRPSRLRTLVLASVGLAAIAAWRLGSVEAVEVPAAAPVRRATPSSAEPARGVSRAAPAELCSTVTALPVRASWSDSEDAPDPFRLRAVSRPVSKVVAPPPAPIAVLAPPVAPEPMPVVAPAPPSLPYRFLGQLAEPDGSDVRVFLLLDEKLLIARPGDTLEGGWRLGAVQPGALKFERVGDAHAITLATDGN